MKKILLVVSCLSIGALSFAQVSQDGSVPRSFTQVLPIDNDNIHHYTLASLDWELIAEEDERRAQNGEIPLISRHVDVNLDLTNSGTWVALPGGDRIWRIKIEGTGAEGLILEFGELNIPVGAEMHVYDQAHSYVIGAFTHEHNPGKAEYSTGIVLGETTYIEYYEPANVAGMGVVRVDRVGHVYRMSGAGGSQPCEVDVACSPESDDWGNQIAGVVRILVSTSSGSGWCSGSLVNNTANDCKPYILFAYHCALPGSGPNFNSFVYYFNYQRTGCGTGGASFSEFVSGSTKLADSGDGGGNSGSDYLLVELNTPVPQSYDPYFNGWNATGDVNTGGVCVHHPAGDVKKISTYTVNTISTTWGGPAGTHWRVRWAGTANGHGVTEGGSSGSPLFDIEGRIIGQLTGGGSFCTATSAFDYYGKMSYNWDQNPAAGDDLKDWLDPVNGGTQLILYGTWYWCANDISEDEAFANSIDLYPNPANTIATFEFDEPLKNGWFEIVNSTGQLVETRQIGSGVMQVNLELDDYVNGLYFINIKDDEHSVTKKLTVAK